MSEERALLRETVERLFAARSAQRAAAGTGAPLDAGLWAQVDALGLASLLVPESAGGAGGSFEDAAVVARAVGRFALPLPLVETLLAAHLLAEAGLERPPGPLGLALHCRGTLRGGGPELRFSGELDAVPWGKSVTGLAAVLPAPAGARVALLDPADATAREARRNLADEPRDRLRFEDAPVSLGPEGSAASAFELAVLLRSAQIAGALASALARSLAHASQREQFGRTLSRFQAVQQALAVMGEEILAVECAVGAACRAADRGEAAFEIACARLRANLAIELATATAHQVHGALGFTREQDLRLYTQRLIAWRSELGNDRFWAGRLGRAVAARGADAFWADLTARSDARDAMRA